ncbi:hypothetical protein Poly30_26550 [Planctomycetes bacterium Poly30]|uniref:Prepilin-type N-terminal cleavage/methylation domain-containing protein n=1 Tax=Saltatorellus ferox TaxID=2528018 RepID=A0A518ESS5_9BACT|nr:hypothetical protein Poly30_26550 [Planctomycetes bacterium Poly30]
MRLPPPRSCRRTNPAGAGFTLVEAALTLAIVALVLVTVLQGMEGAKLSAFQTRQKKTAYELAQGMLGEITVGLWRDELESGMNGTFAEQDEPDFLWEVALGEDVFEEQATDDERPFDNFAARRDWEERNRSDSEEEEYEDGEAPAEPFEKIRIRVTFQKVKDFSNEIVLERWCPWEEIYGPSEEDIAAGEGAAAPAGGNPPGGTGEDAARSGG